MVSVGYDGQLILWNIGSGVPEFRHQIGEGRLFSLNVNWDTRHAVVGTKSGVQLIRIDSGRPLRRRADQPYVSRILQIGNRLLTADGFGRIFERDPETLECKRRFQLFEGDLDVYSNDRFRTVGTLKRSSGNIASLKSHHPESTALSFVNRWRTALLSCSRAASLHDAILQCELSKRMP